jgi:Cys-tRNA(Pro)/Cys-tRNA(Cys) deacylase
MRVNNITRFLDSHNIPYIVFELPPEKLDAKRTADLLGVQAILVFKTIVVKREGRSKHILAVIPGPYQVDLKALAEFMGEKKVYLATQRKAEKITRLKVGGISPLALLNRGFQVVIDISALEHDEIHISGGERGLNIRLPVDDLIKLTNAKIGDIKR